MVGLAETTIRDRINRLGHQLKDAIGYGRQGNPTTLTNLRNAYVGGEDTRVLSLLENINSSAEDRAAFFEDIDFQEYKPSFTILKELITHGDQAIRNEAINTLANYISERADLIAPVELSGKKPEPISQRRNKALKELTVFLQQETGKTGTSEERKELAFRNIGQSLGYLYFEKGCDEITNHHGGDHRVANFFEDMQGSAQSSHATKLLYKVVTEGHGNDFMQRNGNVLSTRNLPEEQRHVLLSDPSIETSLSDRLKAKNSRLQTNTVSVSFLRNFDPVVARNDAEREFLESLDLDGITRNTNFNFKGVAESLYNYQDDTGMSSAPYKRKDLANHILAAYYLQQYRKADAAEAYKNGTLDAKAHRKINRQVDEQLKMLGKLINSPLLLDSSGEVQDVIQQELKKRAPHMFLAAADATEKVLRLTAKTAADAVIARGVKVYGANVFKVNGSASPASGYQDLVTISEQVRTKKQELARSMSDATLRGINPDLALMDFDQLDAFSEAIKRWNPDMTRVGVIDSSSSPQAIEQFSKADPAKGDFFDLQKAADDFRNFLTSSTEPSVVYVVNNWEKIFHKPLADLEFGSPERNEEPGHNKAFCLERVSQAMKPRAQMGGAAEVQVRNGTYNGTLNRILSSKSRLTSAEGLLRDIIQEYKKADERAEVFERTGSNSSLLVRLLRAKSPNKEYRDQTGNSNAHAEARIAASLELARAVQNSSADTLVKQQALAIISEDFLGLAPDALNTQLGNIETNLGTRTRNIEGVIKANRSGMVDDFSSLIQCEFMALDIDEQGLNKIKADMSEKRYDMTKGFLETAYGQEMGHLEEVARSLQGIDVGTRDQLKALITKINKTPEGTVERDNAVVEFMTTLNSAIGAASYKNAFCMLDDEIIIPLSQNLIFNSENGGDIFSDFLKLWHEIVDILLGKRVERKNEKQIPLQVARQDRLSLTTAA